MKLNMAQTRTDLSPNPTAEHPLRQQVLVLYLASSTLDSHVVAWSQFDGTGQNDHMAGDCDAPPYNTGLDALLDGWRLFQASPLTPHTPGDEFRTAYLKYEFFFEKLAELNTSTTPGDADA